MVESEYVIILIPEVSKDRLKSFSTSGGIDTVLGFYQDIFLSIILWLACLLNRKDILTETHEIVTLLKQIKGRWGSILF